MLCQVCNDCRSLYKCPRCLIPYCSLNCWKNHKTEECEVVQTAANNHLKLNSEEIKNTSYYYVTESTVPTDKLKCLGESNELKDILRNNYVRDILKALDKSKNPSVDMERAMQEPIFVEFVDECLKVVESKKQ